MYTRCPECATVFRVTAEQLRMAHGEVRCGNCSKSFNSLLSLMDESPDTEPDAHADHSREPAEDRPLEGDDEFEFDAPEQSWGNFFITPGSAPEILPDTPADQALEFEPLDEQTGEHEEWRGMLDDLDQQNESDVVTLGPEPEPEDDEPTNEHPIISIEPESGTEDEPETDGGISESQNLWVLENVDEPSPILDDAATNEGSRELAAPITQFAYNDYIEDIVLESDELETADPEDSLPPWISEERLDEAFPETATRASRRWYIAAAALLFLLSLQLIHYNRDSLAADPGFGSPIRAAYGMFKIPLFPEWDLNAFKVTGSDAVAGRTADAALDILAEVTVTSPDPVGFPLVRVVLRDRWSNPVANRVFRPAEYLSDATVPADTASPGSTIPIRISVTDPGSDALGYLVDICLPRRSKGLQCQLARDPFL